MKKKKRKFQELVLECAKSRVDAQHLKRTFLRAARRIGATKRMTFAQMVKVLTTP